MAECGRPKLGELERRVRTVLLLCFTPDAVYDPLNDMLLRASLAGGGKYCYCGYGTG